MKTFTGYIITRGYKQLQLFNFDAETCQRISVDTITPHAGTTKKDRYNLLCEHLKIVGIKPPVYTP